MDWPYSNYVSTTNKSHVMAQREVRRHVKTTNGGTAANENFGSRNFGFEKFRYIELSKKWWW